MRIESFSGEAHRAFVSVIIPAFNAGESLARAVTSVLSQTHTLLEVIVINDSSTDGSVSELSLCADPRLRIIHLEQNSGSPARPRNVGVNMATGRWIAFLDADDVWAEVKLEEQVTLLENSGKFAGATNAIRLKSASSNALFFNACPERLDARLLLKRNCVVTSSLIVDSEVLRRCGEFPEEGSRIYEDYAMWLRIASETDILFDPRPLVIYADHASGSFKSRYGNHFGNLKRTFINYSSWRQSQNKGIKFRERVHLFQSLLFAGFVSIFSMLIRR